MTIYLSTVKALFMYVNIIFFTISFLSSPNNSSKFYGFHKPVYTLMIIV